MAGLLRPQAVGRWLMPQLASITPQYVELVLRAALAGAHQQQADLFDLMMDTWPELASCVQELSIGVSERKVAFTPWCEEDEDPTDAAIERKGLVAAALAAMRPDADAPDENDLAGTIGELANGWVGGMILMEIDWGVPSAPGQWHQVRGGKFSGATAPRATAWVHHRQYGFDEAGRIGLADSFNASTYGGRQNVRPLARNKFLVGMHKAKTGTIMGSSLLRPLAWWWCAANFSSDWLLNLAQLFGIPFRWANFDRQASVETIDRVCAMLQNMGSSGYGAFPEGTTIEFLEAGKNGSDHSPQGELLDRADRYARMLLLGQTMSGSQDASKGGGKAFGAVEADVKASRVDACAKYVEGILNRQLIPAILELNYGDDAFAPTLSLETEREEDLVQKAAIVKTLADAGAGSVIGLDWLGKTFDIPKPTEEEETLKKPETEPSVKSVKSVFEEKDEKDLKDEKDIKARFAAILAINDDALFAKELAAMGAALAAKTTTHE
jgi:hypothetical protein